jgi:hypothetical protein
MILALARARAEKRLIVLHEELGARIDRGDEAAVTLYCHVVTALFTLPVHGERAGELLTNRELASRMGVSERTVLRKRVTGELVPAMELGIRNGKRGAARWAAPK